jgi:hypothetical protein
LSAIKEVTKFCSPSEYISKSSADIAAHFPLAWVYVINVLFIILMHFWFAYWIQSLIDENFKFKINFDSTTSWYYVISVNKK